MTSFTLKLIAIITMLIDHIGAIFIPYDNKWYAVFRGIGRLAFPIFIFLIVEGFYHTKNVKKYLLRLGIFAILSEIPFDLAFYHEIYNTDITVNIKRIFQLLSQQKFNSELSYRVTTDLGRVLQYQNVFFTLFLGLLLIILMDKVEQKFNKNILINSSLKGLLIISFCLIAYILKTDYDYRGILLFAAFYLFRGNKILLTFSLLIVNGYMFAYGGQILATLSMIFIIYYNGKKGKDIKYIFYIFYPAHLIILFLIDIYH